MKDLMWPLSEIFGVKDDKQLKNFCSLGDGSIVLWQLPPSIAAELHRSVSMLASSQGNRVAFLLLLQGTQSISLEGLSTLLGQALTRSRTNSLSDWEKSG